MLSRKTEKLTVGFALSSTAVFTWETRGKYASDLNLLDETASGAIEITIK